MNYELAKRLKDAGFPQEYPNGRGTTFYGPDGVSGPNEAYVPTLPELIEAVDVGGGDFSLTHIGDNWHARKHFDDPHCSNHYCAMMKPTAVEAVAYLWLALYDRGTE